MNTVKIRALSDSLDSARKQLDLAKQKYAAMQRIGKCQFTCTVEIDGHRFGLDERDVNYNSAIIRGREMMHLAAVKIMMIIVDEHKDKVMRLESNLLSEVTIKEQAK